jgi:hypothetical protein
MMVMRAYRSSWALPGTAKADLPEFNRIRDLILFSLGLDAADFLRND